MESYLLAQKFIYHMQKPIHLCKNKFNPGNIHVWLVLPMAWLASHELLSWALFLASCTDKSALAQSCSSNESPKLQSC